MSNNFLDLENGQDPRRLETLLLFQHTLDLKFSNISLLDTALTHRSYANESGRRAKAAHNERLEFLGDAVLGQSVASLLFARMRGGSEGDLARIKSLVVSEQVLASIALAIGIPQALRMGKGEELSGGRAKKALLADAVEALIGALFLDQGSDKAQALVERLFHEVIQRSIDAPSKDYKTLIQEYSQKYLKTLPVYNLEKAEGPEHERCFWVSCSLEKRKFGPFSGKTKKEAEQKAAEGVFSALEATSPEEALRLSSIAGYGLGLKSNFLNRISL